MLPIKVSPLSRKLIYPRTVSFYRPNTQNQAQGGIIAGGYLGPNRDAETTLFENLPASIQSRSVGLRRSNTDKLAADAPGPTIWLIMLPAGVLPKAGITESDKMIDDEGSRYQLASAYWNVLGWNIQGVKLEL